MAYKKGMTLTDKKTGQKVKVWNEQNYTNYLNQGFGEAGVSAPSEKLAPVPSGPDVETKPLAGQEPQPAKDISLQSVYKDGKKTLVQAWQVSDYLGRGYTSDYVAPKPAPTPTPTPTKPTQPEGQSYYDINKGDPEITAFGNIGETDPTKRYIKYSDGIEVYDKKTMQHVTAEQASAIPNFWEQVDYSDIVPETITEEKVEEAGIYGIDPSKNFVKYSDSIHVFDKSTGRYISADEASKIQNFWENTEFNEGAKPPELIKPIKPEETDLTDNTNEEINEFNDFITDIVSEAEDEADKFTIDKDEPTTPSDYISTLEDLADEDTAEEIYTELFSTQEMTDAKSKLADASDELQSYEDQLNELKDDIRNEVEGEASASYISALTAIRGEKIMKLKRLAQREYDSASGELKDLKTQATNIANARMKDSDNRYNRMFSMLQLQLQQEGVKFNQGVAMTNIAMQLPEGRSITMPNGDVVKGMKETDDLNIVQFTDASRNVYIIAVDKKTGEEKYRKLLGRSPAPSGAAPRVDPTPSVTLLKETTAATQLEVMEKVKTGAYAIASDDSGSFYYDKAKYDTAKKDDQWWDPFDNVKERDFITYNLK